MTVAAVTLAFKVVLAALAVTVLAVGAAFGVAQAQIALMGMVTTAVTAITTALSASFATIATAGLALAVILPIIAAIGAAAMAAWETLEGVVGAFQEMPTIMPALRQIGELIGEWGPIITSVFRGMAADSNEAMNLLKEGFKLATMEVKALLPPMWEFLKSGFSAVWDYVGTSFSTLFERNFKEISIRAIWSRLSGELTDIGQVKLAKLNADTKVTMDKANADLKEALGKTAEAFGPAVEAAANDPAIKEQRDKVDKLRQHMDATAKKAGEAGSAFGDKAEKGFTKAEHALHKFDAALVGSAEAASRIAEYMEKVWDFKHEGAPEPWRTRNPSVVAMSPVTPLGENAIKGADTSDLPKLAAGGIVKGPMVAMIGEAGPEAVIPLRQMGLRLLAGGGGVSATDYACTVSSQVMQNLCQAIPVAPGREGLRDIACSLRSKLYQDSCTAIAAKLTKEPMPSPPKPEDFMKFLMPRPGGAEGKQYGGSIGPCVGCLSEGGYGTDTVPAMLTPGEYVVNAASARANRGLLEHINASKGMMRRFAGGGSTGGWYPGQVDYNIPLAPGGHGREDPLANAIEKLTASVDKLASKMDSGGGGSFTGWIKGLFGGKPGAGTGPAGVMEEARKAADESAKSSKGHWVQVAGFHEKQKDAIKVAEDARAAGKEPGVSNVLQQTLLDTRKRNEEELARAKVGGRERVTPGIDRPLTDFEKAVQQSREARATEQARKDWGIPRETGETDMEKAVRESREARARADKEAEEARALRQGAKPAGEVEGAAEVKGAPKLSIREQYALRFQREDVERAAREAEAARARVTTIPTEGVEGASDLLAHHQRQLREATRTHERSLANVKQAEGEMTRVENIPSTLHAALRTAKSKLDEAQAVEKMDYGSHPGMGTAYENLQAARAGVEDARREVERIEAEQSKGTVDQHSAARERLNEARLQAIRTGAALERAREDVSTSGAAVEEHREKVGTPVFPKYALQQQKETNERLREVGDTLWEAEKARSEMEEGRTLGEYKGARVRPEAEAKGPSEPEGAGGPVAMYQEDSRQNAMLDTMQGILARLNDPLDIRAGRANVT
jgi:hypothetical protein